MNPRVWLMDLVAAHGGNAPRSRCLGHARPWARLGAVPVQCITRIEKAPHGHVWGFNRYGASCHTISAMALAHVDCGASNVHARNADRHSSMWGNDSMIIPSVTSCQIIRTTPYGWLHPCAP